MSPMGWPEATTILSYISRLGQFWWVKILNFNIFGVSRKISKPDIFFWGGRGRGLTVDAESKYTYQEKVSISPGGSKKTVRSPSPPPPI